jgi:hypothetical protein
MNREESTFIEQTSKMQIAYVIAGKPDQYASLKLWKYFECSENEKESQVLSSKR